MTSQDIFSEFLSMFAFASHILGPADSKALMDVNAAMMLKSQSTVLEPLDPTCGQSPSFIQGRLSFALFFAEGSSGSWLTARVFILLMSGNIRIKNSWAK